jgi:hypothetical protein
MEPEGRGRGRLTIVLIFSSLADPAATGDFYTIATKIFGKYWKYLFLI